MRSLRWLSTSTNRAKVSTQFRTSKKRRDWIPIIGITSVSLVPFRTRTVIPSRTFPNKSRTSMSAKKGHDFENLPFFGMWADREDMEPATIFREHLHLPPKPRRAQRNIRTSPGLLEACLDKCGVIILTLRFESLHQTKQ